jgi:hypothetical protein
MPPVQLIKAKTHGEWIKHMEGGGQVSLPPSKRKNETPKDRRHREWAEKGYKDSHCGGEMIQIATLMGVLEVKDGFEPDYDLFNFPDFESHPNKSGTE